MGSIWFKPTCSWFWQAQIRVCSVGVGCLEVCIRQNKTCCWVWIWRDSYITSVVQSTTDTHYRDEQQAFACFWSQRYSNIHSFFIFFITINLCENTSDGMKTVNLTNTRAVFGVQMDPFIPSRVASYGDSTVCIWDMRNFEKPVLSLQQTKPISKISWCPTQWVLHLVFTYCHLLKTIIFFFQNSSSFLGVLCRDSSSLSLYDIQNANGATTEEMEPTPLERGMILTDGTESISSFAWHLVQENRVLFTTTSLNIRVIMEAIYIVFTSIFPAVLILSSRDKYLVDRMRQSGSGMLSR